MSTFTALAGPHAARAIPNPARVQAAGSALSLAIEGAGKQYTRTVWGLSDLNLRLGPGVLGLLGPNGAGKVHAHAHPGHHYPAHNRPRPVERDGHRPGGRTAPEFVRWCLDTVGVCEGMQRVKFSGKTYILPRSTLPGAAPEAEPIGRGRRQNSRQAQAERLKLAEARRAGLAKKQAEAEAQRGKPRKPRADKGTKRGPNRITKEKEQARASSPAETKAAATPTRAKAPARSKPT